VERRPIWHQVPGPDNARPGRAARRRLYPLGDIQHPATATGLSEAMPKQAQLTNGSVQGNNGRGEPGYTGPCPPAGPAHHYEFKLYALDRLLVLGMGSTKDEVEAAIAGHILARRSSPGSSSEANRLTAGGFTA